MASVAPACSAGQPQPPVGRFSIRGQRFGCSVELSAASKFARVAAASLLTREAGGQAMQRPFVGLYQLTPLIASTVSRAAWTSFSSSPSEMASPGWMPEKNVIGSEIVMRFG